MRERWSKLADAQLKIGSLPSGMMATSCVQPANASVLGADSTGAAGAGAAMGQKGLGLVEAALEEAEKASVGLKVENRDLKALIVDAANAVRKILHKTVSPDPDDLEFVCPLLSLSRALLINDQFFFCVWQCGERSLLYWPRLIFSRLVLLMPRSNDSARCSHRFEMRSRQSGLARVPQPPLWAWGRAQGRT
jgi:hypothetical protein